MVDLPRHAARQVRAQIQPRAADILDRHVSPQGRIIFVPLHDVAEIADAGGGERLDRPGADRVDPQPLGPEIGGEIFHRSLERRFGDAHHVVMRDDFFGTVITQGEQRPAGLHHPPRALGDRAKAVDRDVHRYQEIVEAGVDIAAAKLVLVRKTNRMDDEVESVPSLANRVERLVELGHVADIAFDHEVAAGFGGKRADALAKRLALIAERKVGARFRELLGDPPGERLVIGEAHDQPALSRHQSAHVSTPLCSLTTSSSGAGSSISSSATKGPL